MHRLQFITQLLTHPTPAHLVELVALAAVAAAGIFLASRLSATAFFSLGLGAEMFSGDWKYIHVPVPLERVFELAALSALVLRGRRKHAERRIVVQPLHLLLLAVTAWAVCSAIGAHTFGTSLGFYAILDRLGVVPFLGFVLAPLLFATERQRNILLWTLVICGLYLGITAAAEGLGIHHLVQPSFISDKSLGITVGRARGPFLASDADAMMLFGCACGAAIALTRWTRPWMRFLCVIDIVLAGAGIFFTLTRGTWIGAFVGMVVAMMFDRRLRRWIMPSLAVATLGVAFALSFPTIQAKVSGRVNTSSSIWDRQNTDAAALRLVEQHPLTGIGWETFTTKGSLALRQSPNYPMTGEGLEVHDVYLSHLTELGLIGGSMWILAFGSVLFRGIFQRGPDELYAWRVGFIAFAVMFGVEALVIPLSYPMPNLLFWLLAGIVTMDRYSRPVPKPLPELEADLELPAVAHA